MRSMSIGELLVRVGAPLAVAALFGGVLLLSAARPDRDLQLIALSQVRPGEPMAIRAFLFEGLHRPQGPSLASAEVELRLADRQGRTIARGRLEPSLVAGMEGTLGVPEGVSGPHLLHAEVVEGAHATRAYVPLEIAEGAPGIVLRGRLASPLQQYELFGVVLDGAAPAPDPFEVRVVGGACVPEEPCRLLVRVGEPAAAVGRPPTAAVEVLGDASPEERAGLVVLDVVVHGPEAEVQLVATREGAPVARRTVRLPIAQAAPTLVVDPVWASAPASPRLRVGGVAPGKPIIVDAMREGRWTYTGSTRVGPDGHVPWPLEPLGEGVWRIQVRTDPYGTGSAAARVLPVVAPARGPEGAVRAMARRSVALDLDDALAARVLGEGLDASLTAEEHVVYMAALQELRLAVQPAALSGYVQQTVGAEASIEAWRWVGAAGVLFVGIAVGAYLLWRGLRASAQAGRLVGDDDGAPPTPAWRPVLVVAAVATAFALIFAAIALFILTRGTF
jgi:hypothetical protein